MAWIPPIGMLTRHAIVTSSTRICFHFFHCMYIETSVLVQAVAAVVRGVAYASAPKPFINRSTVPWPRRSAGLPWGQRHRRLHGLHGGNKLIIHSTHMHIIAGQSLTGRPRSGTGWTHGKVLSEQIPRKRPPGVAWSPASRSPRRHPLLSRHACYACYGCDCCWRKYRPTAPTLPVPHLSSGPRRHYAPRRGPTRLPPC